jgi:hypothetical protein
MQATTETSPLRRVGPDALEVRSGSGCLRTIGAVTVVVGGAIAAAALGVVPVAGRETADRSVLAVMAAMGAMLGLPGLALLLARGGLRVDRTAGTVVWWWGLGVPLRRRETALSPFDRVAIGRERRSEGSDVYPVRLAGPGGIEPFTVVTPTSARQAQLAAEDLGKLLRFPVDDDSSGTTVRREADRLDETVRERLRSGGRPPAPALPAAPLRSRVTPGPDGLTIELERLRLPVAAIVEVLVTVVFLVIVGDTLGGLLGSPDARPVVLVVAGGIALLLAVRLVAAMRLGTRVTIDRMTLRVEERTLLKRTVVEIPLDELESLELPRRLAGSAAQPHEPDELEQALESGRLPDGRPMPSWGARLLALVPTHGIRAGSDRVTVTFLDRLPEAELRYLHALLLQAIA